MKKFEDDTVGLIGYGYWGKILRPNIERVLNTKVIVHDPQCGMDNLSGIGECNYLFVATPAKTHRAVIDEYLSSGKNVFCEKPLTLTKTSAHALYDIAKSNDSNLFVDWIFTFNDAVNYIKEQYQSGAFGSIRSVNMNRLNSGPERKDVSAKWDLASHDVSILQYVFNKYPTSVRWMEKKRNTKSYQNDTCLGYLDYGFFDATINSSWAYSQKDRRCVFEFDAGVLVWDDTTGNLVFNGENLEYPRTESPLENSINTFVSGEYDQKYVTISTTEILENDE